MTTYGRTIPSRHFAAEPAQPTPFLSHNRRARACPALDGALHGWTVGGVAVARQPIAIPAARQATHAASGAARTLPAAAGLCLGQLYRGRWRGAALGPPAGAQPAGRVRDGRRLWRAHREAVRDGARSGGARGRGMVSRLARPGWVDSPAPSADPPPRPQVRARRGGSRRLCRRQIARPSAASPGGAFNGWRDRADL